MAFKDYNPSPKASTPPQTAPPTGNRGSTHKSVADIQDSNVILTDAIIVLTMVPPPPLLPTILTLKSNRNYWVLRGGNFKRWLGLCPHVHTEEWISALS